MEVSLLQYGNTGKTKVSLKKDAGHTHLKAVTIT